MLRLPVQRLCSGFRRILLVAPGLSYSGHSRALNLNFKWREDYSHCGFRNSIRICRMSPIPTTWPTRPLWSVTSIRSAGDGTELVTIDVIGCTCGVLQRTQDLSRQVLQSFPLWYGRRMELLTLLGSRPRVQGLASRTSGSVRDCRTCRRLWRVYRSTSVSPCASVSPPHSRIALSTVMNRRQKQPGHQKPNIKVRRFPIDWLDEPLIKNIFTTNHVVCYEKLE